MSEEKTLLQERIELFDNAMHFRHNKRTPLHSNIVDWKYFEFFTPGIDLNTIKRNYALNTKIHDEFHKKYQFDSYMDTGGLRNPVKIGDALGNHFHMIHGDVIEAFDHSTLEREDYKGLAENLTATLWTKSMPNCARKGVTVGELKRALQEFIEVGTYGGYSSNRTLETYQALLLNKYNISSPMDYLFYGLRGIKDLSVDLRKCKSDIKGALDAIWELTGAPELEQCFSEDCEGYVANVDLGMLAHSILNRKQFEELYWPYMKKVIDKAIACKQTILLFCESDMLRFAEFFEDIPKGVIMVLSEQDDVFELRKRLPNLAVCGGMPTSLLGRGTKEQCVDYAKKLIDEMGDGFVLSQDRMLTYRTDATPENLLAVNEFVRNYTL